MINSNGTFASCYLNLKIIHKLSIQIWKDHRICSIPFVLAMLIHTREIISQVANEQRFGCQCTNPPEHLYSIKLEVYVKDVCAQSLSNRLKWLLLVFCQIKRNFSDYKCDFFNSPTANFLGITSSCFLEGLPTTKSSVFIKAWRYNLQSACELAWNEDKEAKHKQK